MSRAQVLQQATVPLALPMVGIGPLAVLVRALGIPALPSMITRDLASQKLCLSELIELGQQSEQLVVAHHQVGYLVQL